MNDIVGLAIFTFTDTAMWAEPRMSTLFSNCDSGEKIPHPPSQKWGAGRRGYRNVSHLQRILDGQLWAAHGEVDLKHIMSDGRLMGFSDLKTTYNLTNSMFFKYLQLRHAVQVQFPALITLVSDPIE